MATAEVKETVTKTVVQSVTLALSEAEAETLAAILANVGGHNTHSPRVHATEIFMALTDAYYTDWYDGPIARLA